METQKTEEAQEACNTELGKARSESANALAAYNAGPERRSLSAGYVPAIPETRNYVRTITTNWARLAQLGVGGNDAASRGEAAMVAVHASAYRSVELVRYDGLNAANPM